MICSKCHVLCSSVCPKCGKAKHLREAAGDEQVLLMVLTSVQQMLVEPILKEEKIPYKCVGILGGALTAYLGNMLETYSVYVPGDQYTAIYDKLSEIFAEDTGVRAALDEFRER